MSLSSASSESITRRPPMGWARSRKSPCEKARSASTQTSSGSPSPVSRGRPVRRHASSETRSPEKVCGMKPYRLGQTLENFCGRSTLRCPVTLSTSYLTASEGTIST